MERYAILQEKFEAIDPELLRTALIEQGGLVPVDAARIARKVRGVLTDRLSFQQAAAICQVLKSHGYAVRVLPVKSLVPEAKARVVRWFEMDDQQIRIPLGYHGQVNKIPWSSVFVISAGRVSEIKEHRTEKVERYSSSRMGIVTEHETHRRSTTADVTELVCVAESGSFLHVRFPYNEMNYDRVFGAQLNLSVFERYLAMVEALVSHGTSALVSPETTRLLQERKQHYETTDGDWAHYSEEKEFAAYNRWLLQLVLLSEGFCDSNSTSETDA
jgi:hypothetical protein